MLGWISVSQYNSGIELEKQEGLSDMDDFTDGERVFFKIIKKICLPQVGMLLMLLIGFFISWGMIPNAEADETRQAFEKRFDEYSDHERGVVIANTEKALSKLPSSAGELEKVAAINDYLFQYFILRANEGGGAKLLSDGYAICGGAAVALAEMLYGIGIRCRKAFLIGIPGMGSHGMIEVFFRDGQRGLFDPTFGIFWFNKEKKQILSIAELMENPDLSVKHLQRSIHMKRTAETSLVVTSSGINQTYRSHHVGQDQLPYDPYLCFSTCSGGGIAGEEYMTFVKIPLVPGDLHGLPHGQVDSLHPWYPLARLADENGRFISWAYMLGKSGTYNVAHIYRFSKLRAGALYRLTLTYAHASTAIVSMQILDGKLPEQKSDTTIHLELPSLNYKQENPHSEETGIVFVSESDSVDIIATSQGYVILTAIGVSEIIQ